MDDGLAHRFIDVNGVRLHIAEQGAGPLVLLLHGWPESWYSWRHQFGALASAGYRVVAPDQRGYARSEQPSEVASYSLLHLVGDVIALIEELGEERAVVVGHDWGAPVAWTAAMLRPDKVRAVVGLSVPPILPGGMIRPSITREQYGERFYQVYFQQPGVADAEFAKDIPTSFRRVLFGASGDNPHVPEPRPLVIPEGRGILDVMPDPPALPAWLTEEDIQAYVDDFAPRGERAFTGAFNWYRNIERNNELMAPFRGRRIEAPALYVVGDRDMVTSLRPADGGSSMAEIISGEAPTDRLRALAPQLRGPVVLRGCGHWTQQERPIEVNAALLDFLAEVDGPVPGDTRPRR
ncbi:MULTISPECIES: alpha/beta fold hydrolase [Nocardioides]|uniref:Alpha/beta fold hydrolase n=1 Tax=Nocardioides vastitatis TaxID=2568655 RepID=A0ABW0ZKF7_9ACTN|nr:alpha/beta hydrolase [Nocardioides sp.]THJ16057.1 alpha/beta hydrolase [Nocardioides sp.]